MTTYNGEKYIIKQLDSIRIQTRIPDEVIICDDCSTDSTLELVSQYIKKWKLSNWQFIAGKDNLGWKRNFYKALNLTHGDVVFFCDQDDIWKHNKIELMYETISENDEIEVLCCTTSFIDGEDKLIHVSSEALPYGKKGNQKIIQNVVNKKFIYSIMPGCTMGITRKFIKRLSAELQDEDITSKIPHDALFWKTATLENCAFILNEDLIMYRIHSSNSSTPQTASSFKAKSKEVRIKEINTNRTEMLYFRELYKRLKGKKFAKLLDKLIAFCDWRIAFIKNKNIKGIISNCKYYRNLKMFCGDVAACLLNR